MTTLVRITVLAAVLGLALLTTSARPASPATTTLELGFTTAQPDVPAGVSLHIGYPDGPDGKTKRLRFGAIDLPDGTRIDERAVPVCTATDDELMTVGMSACPADTRVGRGEITIVSGCGPPVDPFKLDIHTFHAPGQLIYLYTQPGTDGPVLYVERDVIVGATLRSQKPIETPPGCPPPDGRLTPVDGRLTLDRIVRGGRAFITTPSSCPSAQAWRGAVTLDFWDGSRERASATTPCSPAAVRGPEKPALRVTVAPRRATVGVRTRFRFAVSSPSPDCVAGAFIRFARRGTHTNRSGTATMRRRLRHPGRYRVVVTKAGCRRGVATVHVSRAE